MDKIFTKAYLIECVADYNLKHSFTKDAYSNINHLWLQYYIRTTIRSIYLEIMESKDGL